MLIECQKTLKEYHPIRKKHTVNGNGGNTIDLLTDSS